MDFELSRTLVVGTGNVGIYLRSACKSAVVSVFLNEVFLRSDWAYFADGEDAKTALLRTRARMPNHFEGNDLMLIHSTMDSMMDSMEA